MESACKYCMDMKIDPYRPLRNTLKCAAQDLGRIELKLTMCIIRYDPIMDQINAAHTDLYGKTIFEKCRRRDERRLPRPFAGCAQIGLDCEIFYYLIFSRKSKVNTLE